MEFEWDPEKADTNATLHGVTFHEAATVFGDPLALSFSDFDHSIDEQRFITFGVSLFRQLIVVSHTYRDGRLRIISARLMTRHERKMYEEG
jgi:hypothetical protein